MEQGHEIVKMNLNDVGIVMKYINDGTKVQLWWTDYVANDWTEVFDTLGQAFSRLALLIECCDNDWGRFFMGEEGFHKEEHKKFVEASLSPAAL